MEKDRLTTKEAISIIGDKYFLIYKTTELKKQKLIESLNKRCKNKKLEYTNKNFFEEWVEEKIKKCYQDEMKEYDLIKKILQEFPFKSNGKSETIIKGIFTLIGALITGPFTYWIGSKNCLFIFLFLFV